MDDSDNVWNGLLYLGVLYREAEPVQHVVTGIFKLVHTSVNKAAPSASVKQCVLL